MSIVCHLAFDIVIHLFFFWVKRVIHSLNVTNELFSRQLLYFDQEESGGLSLALQVHFTFS